jgi:para-aminobenzoate synthetase component I
MGKTDIQNLLSEADQSEVFMYITGSQYHYPHGSFPDLLATGAKEGVTLDSETAFIDLHSFLNNKKGAVFGFLGYDLKNRIEKLQSGNPRFIDFGDGYFFLPEKLLSIRHGKKETPHPVTPKPVSWKNTVTREHYINNVNIIREHILEGDIYELNYCIEFQAENVSIDPIALFLNLQQVSPMPFSCLFKKEGKYLLCASPERFMKKVGATLISQPIKGTAGRGNSEIEDKKLMDQLRNSEKEQAENIMIVDLVRNDLARSSKPGTVKVEELFGIYSFPQVHQMISTVTSEIRPEITPVQAIVNAFPMGSMTGAPKIRAMQLIDKYETSARGLFSGAIGYFEPGGNFDFNVVIRSIFYDSNRNKMSFQVGSAITYDSDPEKEYEECLLKAQAIFNITSVQ